jgi:hypothetical protein
MKEASSVKEIRSPADVLVSSPALHAFLAVAALWFLTSMATIAYSAC